MAGRCCWLARDVAQKRNARHRIGPELLLMRLLGRLRIGVQRRGQQAGQRGAGAFAVPRSRSSLIA